MKHNNLLNKGLCVGVIYHAIISVRNSAKSYDNKAGNKQNDQIQIKMTVLQKWFTQNRVAYF